MIENIKFDLLKMWRNHILRPHTETVQFIEKQPHQLLLNERIRFILRDLIVKQYQIFRKDLTGIGGNRTPVGMGNSIRNSFIPGSSRMIHE